MTTMGTADWLMYVFIVLGAVLFGFLAGQLIQWRRYRLVVGPEVPMTSRAKRLAGLALSLLAVLTVVSSTLTSNAVRKAQIEQTERGKAKAECLVTLTETIVERARISDEDHANTTRYVEGIEEGLQLMLESPSRIEQAQKDLLETARLFNERQGELQAERDDWRFNTDSCR